MLEEENLCLRVAAGRMPGPCWRLQLNSELDFLQTLGRAPLDEVFPGRGSVPAAVGDNARRRLPRGL